MEGRKIALTLSGEALAILEANATERKRGEFVSAVLLEWHATQTGGKEPGILESIAAGVRRIERKMEGVS